MVLQRVRNVVRGFLSPERTLILSFLGIIAVGTFLLCLPSAARVGSASLVDALFTATSAVCVTGLIVVDTGRFYAPFGQVVILILIQLGGLGIMTFSVFFYLLMGHSIGFRDRRIIETTFSQFPTRDIYHLLKSVFAYTIVIESIGVGCLFLMWIGRFPLMETIYLSLFHAISAFCNAGFCLFSDSLIGFRENIPLNLCITSLIILGGIGFIVLKDLFELRVRGQGRRRISLHSKVVLVTSAALIGSGMVIIFLIERDNILSPYPLGKQFLMAYFQSVTSRTAGFNTIPVVGLSNATCFILILLMFIGASPGSCGGGIKTTNVATLISLALNRYKGRDRADLFRRTVPPETVARSISIALASGVGVIFITVLLLITQLGNLSHLESRGLFLEYLFEATSAFGTVGLSMGVTPGLNAMGKLIVVIMMLLGRLGPLTLAFAMGRRVERGVFQFAEENILVG
jgi:trk system potassium uptake protein TrkH